MANLSKEKTQQIILVILVTLIALSSVWFFLIDRELRQLRITKKSIEKAEREVADAERKSKMAASILNDLTEAQAKLSAIESEMASGDYFMWSYKLMESSMTANNLKIIDSERPKEDEVGLFVQFPYKAISFAVRANGYFHDFGTFLRDFENRYPFMRCRNLSLISDSIPTATDRERLTIRFEVVALIKPNNS
jgi:Tfp pilus assembly protein PilO